MGTNRPTWLPQATQFSQADPHIVQRPEGIDATGGQGTEVKDIERGAIEKYATGQVSPGQWHERRPLTTSALVMGGITLLIDDSLGFPANSVLVDNYTNQWLYIDGVRRYVPPYSGGWIFALPSATQQGRVALQTPSPAIAQAAAVAGESVFVGFAEAFLPPQSGVLLGVSAPIAGVIPASAPSVAPVGTYGWVEGRGQWVPISATPSPTHLSAAILETSLPQELVANSHPAAGSTATLTITNPGVNNSRLIAITGYNFSLAQGTASAGQANNGAITGSAGGQYTAEAVCLGTTANTDDRVVQTGRTFVTGNGTPANVTENFTLGFAVAGIANLFQQVNAYYRLGA